ncbi:MAG: phosphoglucosamine mutase [Actinomycetia bacterium]|nr:phosphoglucosamine mutase [Actinomycetes bacterium]
MSLSFGTDGVRGLANLDLTPELAMALGRAAARVLGPETFMIGRDTRRSGPLLEAALAAGLASEGSEVELLGVVPTPAVAHAAAQADRPGAVISASHNPFADNGIKLFAKGGRKLPNEVEAAIEREVIGLHDAGRPTGADVGRIGASVAGPQGWLDTVSGSIHGRRLDGLRIVVDTANGALSRFAGPVLEGLGATVTVLADQPDGLNINDGVGSNHPERLAAEVLGQGADLGIAFDGDADRMVAVAGDGVVVDGDHIIALCALDLRRRGRLANDTVVVTVMTNLGFRLAMADTGIDVVTTGVGDRHVLEALDAGGFSLGGEQSGHIIFRDLATTGDGLLSAVQLLDLVVRSGEPLGDLAAAAMTRLPQVLVNVAVSERVPDVADQLASQIAEVEAELGSNGRVLIRPSGTEPLIRVMVEATDQATAEAVTARLAAEVEARF